MSVIQTTNEVYENGYDAGFLKGSEVGDATARRALRERDVDMARLQKERLEWVKERDALRAALEQIRDTWDISDPFRVVPKLHDGELARNDSLAAGAIINAIKVLNK